VSTTSITSATSVEVGGQYNWGGDGVRSIGGIRYDTWSIYRFAKGRGYGGQSIGGGEDGGWFVGGGDGGHPVRGGEYG